MVFCLSSPLSNVFTFILSTSYCLNSFFHYKISLLMYNDCEKRNCILLRMCDVLHKSPTIKQSNSTLHLAAGSNWHVSLDSLLEGCLLTYRLALAQHIPWSVHMFLFVFAVCLLLLMVILDLVTYGSYYSCFLQGNSFQRVSSTSNLPFTVCTFFLVCFISNKQWFTYLLCLFTILLRNVSNLLFTSSLSWMLSIGFMAYWTST